MNPVKTLDEIAIQHLSLDTDHLDARIRAAIEDAFLAGILHERRAVLAFERGES